MNQLLERLRENFEDEDARYAYADAFLNASIAAQIKSLRDAEEVSQEELAARIGTKQSGISRLENGNYSAWKVETLRKLARAFGLRLRISFEEFGTLVPEIEDFKRSTLRKRAFARDPVFQPVVKSHALTERGTATHLVDMPQPQITNGNESFGGMARGMGSVSGNDSNPAIPPCSASFQWHILEEATA